jgi:aldehyde:ferredoxin oxidoreductase
MAATRVLRVNLTERRINVEHLDDETSRKCLGGLGMGVRFLYDEAAPGIDWSNLVTG